MTYIDTQKALINDAIVAYLARTDDVQFGEAAKYVVYPEGHRYRSLVGLEVYKMLGGKQERFFTGVVGIECIHHASLVFDDLPCMDDAQIRKGKPTAHKKYGEATAILAGLHLWNTGRHLLYENARQHSLTPEAVDAIESLVTNCITGMLSGQELDLKRGKNVTEIFHSIYQKNLIFHLSCVLPAYLLEKREYVTPLSNVGTSLDEIGMNLAEGYQLFDDLRDVEGNPNITGKPVSVDEENTVQKIGIVRVRQELDQRKAQIISNLRKIPNSSALEMIIEYILTTPS